MKKLIKKILPSFAISWYHFGLAFFGAVIYRFPSKKIKVIGVTGTNGKTTTVDLIAAVFKEAGFKTAFLSSIKFKIGEKERPNALKMTMPGRFKIQKFLREAVNSGCQYAVLEVSSEGIKQHRHKFIDFSVAVFTNLTPEHIESHGGFGKYRIAKGELFKTAKKVHIINIDDEHADYFLKFPAEKTYTYGIEKGDINNKNLQLKLRLLGDFNIYNALAAVSVGVSQGISVEICRKAVEKAKGIPGRMELVIKSPFKAIIDYAVTPDALEKLYRTIKKMFPGGEIIAVFGACGGGRDKWKRPVLGEIAAKYCGKIIITNEDPYDEDPERTLSAIKSGILKTEFPANNLYEILDRREAIKKALGLANAGGIVAITGKGSEIWMCLAGGKKIPWSDKDIVLEEFGKIKR